MNFLSAYGYTDSFWYSLGKDMKAKFIGWVGNNSSDPETILEDIVTMKKNNPVPKVRLKLKNEEKVFFRSAALNFTRVRYPLGRCFKVVYPEASVNATLNGIILSWPIGKEKNTNIFYVVHLMGKNSGFKPKKHRNKYMP